MVCCCLATNSFAWTNIDQHILVPIFLLKVAMINLLSISVDLNSVTNPCGVSLLLGSLSQIWHYANGTGFWWSLGFHLHFLHHLINTSCPELFCSRKQKDVFAVSNFSDNWDGASSLNHSSLKTRSRLSYIVSGMAAEDVATQGVRAFIH